MIIDFELQLIDMIQNRYNLIILQKQLHKNGRPYNELIQNITLTDYFLSFFGYTDLQTSLYCLLKMGTVPEHLNRTIFSFI